MKLKDFLDQFPWEETREALFREPPARDELQLGHALQLIERYRKSQLRILLRMLHGPVLEDNFGRGEVVDEVGAARREARLKLRDPVEASQLFLAVAAQRGKALGPFGSERLNELKPLDAALGRLLLLLSITETLSWERRAHSDQWLEVVHIGLDAELDPPFGAVLTPMVFVAWRGSHGPFWRQLAERLRVATRDERVINWTMELVEAGAEHLLALSDNGLSLAVRQHEGRVPEADRHTRDVRLVKAEERCDEFLSALKSIPGVEKQTRFIEEEDPRFMRIRIWSAEQIPDETLAGLAEKTGARIASATEDHLA